VIIAYVTGRAPRELRPFSLVGKPAPALHLLTLEEKKFESAAAGWRLIHFWTTSCSECRGEIPELRRFLEKSRSGLPAVLLLNVNIQDKPQTAARYAAEFGVPGVVLLDVDGQVARSFGVTGVPETFFLDAAGIVRHHAVGSLETEEIERIFELLQRDSSPNTFP
jgi:cytochrome c biogenesis protein CcmG/thiol:disulfide interchange protein DsbE